MEPSDLPLPSALWAALLSRVPLPILQTLGVFLVHEAAYWLAYLPFYLLSLSASFDRYLLQPRSSPPSRASLRNCLAAVARTHVFLVLPVVAVTHPLLDLAGATSSVRALPTFARLAAQLVFFFVLEDALFYFGHRALHTPWMYRNIHAVHHTHSAPFGIAAEYAHPVEVVFLGLSTIIPPLLVAPHLFTLYVYMVLRAFQTVECHSGYDLPVSPRHWIPGYGGARFHDHHHRIHSGNLSSTFIWMDWIAGTDLAYRDWEIKELKKEAAGIKKPDIAPARTSRQQSCKAT